VGSRSGCFAQPRRPRACSIAPFPKAEARSRRQGLQMSGPECPDTEAGRSDRGKFFKETRRSRYQGRAGAACRTNPESGWRRNGRRLLACGRWICTAGRSYELYEKRRFNDTPILIGTNSNEGGLFMRQPVTAAAFEKQVRSGYGERADVLLNAYPHATDAEASRSSADLFRESAFAWPTWAWARMQSQKGKGKTFVYYFDHRTPQSPNGADHGAEVTYVFQNFAGPGALPAGGFGSFRSDPILLD